MSSLPGKSIAMRTPVVAEDSSSGLSGFLAPECPVCWESYDLNGRSPRLIACGHTICQRCAASLPVTRDFFGKRCISCPECRCLVVWKGMASLPKNFALQRVVSEVLPSTQKNRKPSAPGFRSLVRQLDAWAMVYYISNLASVVSVLFGVLLGMLVFIPLCFVYVAVSWLIASLTLFAFTLLTAAALGFGTAGGLSFFSYQISKHCRLWSS